ncbi:hypothetical protein I79_016053 [Cricetulus griseus]|uniref:Uncharacterized protein n=1 Tax=Cricetulus griseus TaxID=10029 RepID=G3HYC8_CRIGR|nr:hypothetical protein I79_016053 [Cricetulus griseus]
MASMNHKNRHDTVTLRVQSWHANMAVTNSSLIGLNTSSTRGKPYLAPETSPTTQGE